METPKLNISCTLCCNSKFFKSIPREIGGTVYECSICGHIFLWPITSPEVVESYYSSSAALKAEKLGTALFDNIAFKLLKRSDPRRGISVIDIGCGLGEFLRVCKSSDLNVIGLEVTKDIVDVLIKEGFDVLNYSLLEFSKKQRRFDWVTCLDVIEHLNNPIETIESLVNLVNEGGLLLIQSPNSKSISKYGEKAYSLTVDREHLNYFNPDTLIRIFSQYGFTLVKKKFLPENSSSVLKNSKKQFIPAEIRPYRSNINITGLRKIIKKMPAPIRGILRSFVQIKRILLAYNDIKNETAHEFVLLFKRVKTS